MMYRAAGATVVCTLAWLSHIVSCSVNQAVVANHVASGAAAFNGRGLAGRNNAIRRSGAAMF